ncbi:uncharacterized protein [Nicotiana tomentosiformis]|uniref:uncharacterized protein n=1 Tax=Nicotiana tomentosiformis TaxID=4098 RepID=UPI00388C6854
MDLREFVVEVRRVNDRLMTIKLVVGEYAINVVSTYTPQSGLDEEVKRRFWEGLDEIVRGFSPPERLFMREDFNGHIGSTLAAMARCMAALVLGIEMEEVLRCWILLRLLRW